MNLQLAIILLMLAASIAVFVTNQPRMDGVALLILTLMPFTGVITMNEALKAGYRLDWSKNCRTDPQEASR